MNSDFRKGAVHGPLHYRIGVSGLPKRYGQLIVVLDLPRKHADVATFDAELIVPGAVLGIVRPHLLVAERF